MMRKANYVFRLDDISYDMNLTNFRRIQSILDRHGVQPIIGVIPCNRDPKLAAYGKDSGMAEDSFWLMVQNLQREKGWSIALHGYDHVYCSQKGGILKTHDRSEFAGLSEAEQDRKISMGKKILEEHGLQIAAFMAPAHTFDKTTLKVLASHGIHTITDGFGLYPYRKQGITFVPQMMARPLVMSFGIYTICLHPNTMREKDFDRIEAFLSQYKANVIRFEEAANMTADNAFKKLLNLLVRCCFSIRATSKLIRKKAKKIPLFQGGA
jgi:predicted deacetylase